MFGCEDGRSQEVPVSWMDTRKPHRTQRKNASFFEALGASHRVELQGKASIGDVSSNKDTGGMVVVGVSVWITVHAEDEFLFTVNTV